MLLITYACYLMKETGIGRPNHLAMGEKASYLVLSYGKLYGTFRYLFLSIENPYRS